MIYSNEMEFAKELKEGKEYPLYLLCGSEDYLIGLYLQKLRKKYLPAGQDSFNESFMDGKEYTSLSFSQLLEAMPLLSEKRLVQLENPDIAKLGADKEFEEMVSDIPPYTVLIIVLRQTEFAPQKQKSHKEFQKICSTYGAVVELGERKEGDLIRFCQATLEKQEIILDRAEAQFLLQRCGHEMNKLSSELAKLSVFVDGGNRVTKADIENVTIATLDAKIYDLSKSVTAGDIKKAMEIIDQLFAMQEHPLVILSALSQQYTQLYKAFLAKRSNIAMEQAATVFGYRADDFRIKNAFRDCNKYQESFYHQVLDILVHADYQLKSSRMDNRVVLERAVVEIFMAKARKDRT